MKKFVYAAAFGLSLLSGAALAANPEGTWLSGDGGTKVYISNCDGKLCGKVVWLQQPVDSKTGKPKTDALNPDPAKQSRPMIGLQVVHGLAPNGPNKWSGQIYNADDGKTYAANMEMQGDDAAKVEGCVLGILCKGQTWKRASN
ncbi:MAG TPA: DUF2147 domain-containing protein [Pseudolabrys sp.]|nr:DUF2147 domain-containing protein [Pseudolabrys sp.]